MNRAIRIEMDREADAAYIALSDNEIVRTRQLTEEVNVDLDEFDVVVGIEVLGLKANIPFDRLREVHVRSEVIDLIQLIRPNVDGFVLSATSVSAGGAAATPQAKSPQLQLN